MVIGLRLLSLMHRMPHSDARHIPDDLELPVYSVLVPLFRETEIVRQLIRALLRLDYPRQRLDIKLVLEETDAKMRRYCARLKLPSHIEIIIVPRFGPQTKPKALNYALSFARGELLTIFDAEDIPHPRQLKRAAAQFAAAPPQLACLQARLCFYDAERNWLTRQFAAEYAALFSVMLPMLAKLALPLPLGGTSNHFRTAVLRELGAWDPYNVTEDADLGIRLSRRGYLSGVLDCDTLEEPNGSLPNWLKQRARWLKGWMQTWLVHMREPARLHRETGWHGFWALQALIGGIVASSLLHPLLMLLTLWSLLAGNAFPAYPDEFTAFAGAASITVLIVGYGVAIAAAAEGLRRQGRGRWSVTLLTMPFYWLLISAAAWLALWQFICDPHSWNKTQHGYRVSRGRREDFTTPETPH
jgi:cellulose synthase/poly-beta-1,6-N-acetylglucosamine synthase-like glycosyltransferase